MSRKTPRPPKRTNIQEYLTVLGNIAFYLGVVDFRYDSPKNTIKCTKFNTFLSSGLVVILTVWFAILSIGRLVTFIVTSLLLDITLKQTFEIQLLSNFVQYLPVFLYACSHLITKHHLLWVVMDMHRIFKALKDASLPRLYYREDTIGLLLHIKLAYVGVRVAKKLWDYTVVDTSVFNFGYLYGQVLCSILDMGFVFSQLFLVCIYEKMTEVLKKRRRHMNTSALRRRISRFLRISAAIHRVKRVCDELFLWLFGASLVALLWNVIEVNSAAKVDWIVILRDQLLCVYLEPMLNIFLVQFLSGMFLEAYATFHYTVLRVVSKQLHPLGEKLEPDMEVFVLGKSFQRLHTWACGAVGVRFPFLWKHILNVVVIEIFFRLHNVKMPKEPPISEPLPSSSEELGSADDDFLDYDTM